jgi:membrane protein
MTTKANIRDWIQARLAAPGILRLVAAVMRDLDDGMLQLRAKGLVYMTMLSLAPLLALCFSVLKGFGVSNQLEPFLLSLFEPLGDAKHDIVARIAGFVNNVQVGVLGTVGLAVLVYGTVSLMHDIEIAFNDIWRVTARRPLLVRLRDYISLLLIGPFLMFVSLAITASMRHTDIFAGMFGEVYIAGALDIIGQVLAEVLFVLAFAALYMFMPYTRVRAWPALLAGLVTALVWKVLGQVFAFFVAGSASYAAIYSAFAALILFVLWMYIGWLTVLAGASLCYYVQNPSNQSVSRRGRHVSARVRENVALDICRAVGDAFYNDKGKPDLVMLSAQLSLPVVVIEDVADDLLATGMLAQSCGEKKCLIPGRPFDTTTVGAMLGLFRSVGETGGLRPDSRPAAELSDKTLKQVVTEDKDA